jgi:hypothetical protein
MRRSEFCVVGERRGVSATCEFARHVALTLRRSPYLPEDPRVDRYKLLAAEIYGYSYDSYEDHLGIGNIRYEKLMPDDARMLEEALAENWPIEKVARKLEFDEVQAETSLRACRNALEVVDAENPAESFSCGVRQVIEKAIQNGLRDENSVERLVTQICFRAADLGFLLKREDKSLSRYSRHLRKEPGVGYPEGYFDE